MFVGAVTDVPGRVLLVGTGDAVRDLRAALTAEGWVCDESDKLIGVLVALHVNPDLHGVLFVPDGNLRPYVELCRQVKFDPRTALVAAVFALSGENAASREQAYAAGADDCIELPAPPREIVRRMSRACRAKQATDSLEDATVLMSSLANAIEGRDIYTRGHVERVSTYATELGRRIGVSDRDLYTLRLGGIVHDIGKVAVPDHILNKPGRLTDEEFAIVQRHPVVGHDILQPSRSFRGVLPLVRWHHERPNGTGYPDGLRGDRLPLLPRIVAVADVFDALSTSRSYRPAFAMDKCIAILRDAAAKGELDPELVELLLEILSETPLAVAGASPARP